MDTVMNIIWWWSLAGFIALTALYFALPTLVDKFFNTNDEE